MEIVILASALKRDITAEDILHALDNPFWTTDMDGAVMVVGADPGFRLIEVGVRTDADRLIVFHSFRPARPQFLPER